jgi:hypothetical protein
LGHRRPAAIAAELGQQGVDQVECVVADIDRDLAHRDVDRVAERRWGDRCGLQRHPRLVELGQLVALQARSDRRFGQPLEIPPHSPVAGGRLQPEDRRADAGQPERRARPLLLGPGRGRMVEPALTPHPLS